MKTFYLIRGVPGSGKSTVAKNIIELAGNNYTTAHYEADMYFYRNGEYKFDQRLLPAAHKWCREKTHEAVERGVDIVIVSNTSIKEWEITPYHDLAKEYGYQFISLIVEHRHSGNSIHNVPSDVIKRHEKTMAIKLV